MKFEPYFMTITVTTTIQHKCCYKQWWKSQRETASPFCKGEVTFLPQSPHLSQLNRFQTERLFPGQWLRESAPPQNPVFFTVSKQDFEIPFLFTASLKIGGY